MPASPRKKKAAVPDGIIGELAQPGAIESMSMPDLNALIARATAAKAGKLEAARKTLLEETRARFQELDLPLNALVPREPALSAGKGNRKPAPVKYRGPDGTSWSGRGRTPRVFADLVSQGRKMDEFLVRKR
ncbi:H-NS family nucleoid-associated regulatory protein [Rhodopila sp.]|uniref:H-NS histone family protein n=1 Tax=Rhodopila sp. TaxID=2480087 RepID=UPI003D0D4B5E